MPTDSHCPRSGRVLDYLVIGLLSFVFAGLGLYHYRRLDRSMVDEDKAKELAERKLTDQRRDSHDWPGWRGPNRDGVSTESGLLTNWPANGPKLLWQQRTGEGFASVAVVNGRVFTIYQDQGNESVACWNAETGKEHWRFTYPCYYQNSYGNGPRSTPTVSGDCVYTVGGTGMMHCLKAFSDNPGGELVWSKDLMGEFNAEVPKWGVAFSPLVEDGRVFIMPGGSDGNALAALDPRTGAVLWKKHDDPASYASPIGATFQGRRQILFFTGTRLVSVRPDTGEQLWDFAWPVEYNCNIATPIVVDEYVYISSGYGRGCAMLKIDKTGETWQPSLVYKNRNMKTHFSSCVRHQDHVFGFDDSNLTCMNIRTGKVAWKERGFDKGSVLLADDRLIIYGESGVLALAEANPAEYREISRFQFSDEKRSCWSVPVVAEGRLYVRDQQKLACFDVKKADPVRIGFDMLPKN
jgi:outer membrane protein assembly factor BamB